MTCKREYRIKMKKQIGRERMDEEEKKKKKKKRKREREREKKMKRRGAAANTNAMMRWHCSGCRRG